MYFVTNPNKLFKPRSQCCYFYFSFSGGASSEESEIETDSEVCDLEIDLPQESSPGSPQSSDSALYDYSEDDVVSPVSIPHSSHSSFSYLSSHEDHSALSAQAATPSSAPETDPRAATFYLEQRDHTYLSKKQLQYIGTNHVSGPRVLRNRRQRQVQESVPSSSVASVQIASQTAESQALPQNPSVLEEHGYVINFAEKQQENIRRDHNYGYTSVLKGRRLSKFRKSVRANTQSSTLDHAYEPESEYSKD